MEAKNYVHHSILIRAMIHPDVEYKGDESIDDMNCYIMWLRKNTANFDGLLWGYDYYESLIGDRRDLTKEEYKKIMHYERRESFEFNKNYEDQGYVPDYNPGGGPYYLES